MRDFSTSFTANAFKQLQENLNENLSVSILQSSFKSSTGQKISCSMSLGVENGDKYPKKFILIMNHSKHLEAPGIGFLLQSIAN